MPLSSSSRTSSSRLICGSVVKTIETSAWPLVEHLVALRDVDRHELLELQAVDLLQAEQAVAARWRHSGEP